jgi:hypothetical protein
MPMVGHRPRSARALIFVSLVALLGGLIWAPSVSAAVTLYVAPLPTAIGDGSSCASPGFNTIQAAVNAAVAGDTVHVCSGTHSLSAEVTVPVLLTFEGDDAATSIVDGSGSVRLINAGGNDIAVTDMTLQNGRTLSVGGAIFTTGSLTVTRSIVRNNTASGDGGGVFGNPVTVTDSTFDSNQSNGFFGGALRALVGGVTVTGSTFTNNSITGGFGSAINTPGPLTVTNSTFTGNNAATSGTVVSTGGTTITNSTFTGNTAVGISAIHTQGSVLTLTNTVIADDSLSNNCAADIFDDGGGNFSTDATCGLTQPSSQVAALADLALQGLADNGGPTETIGLGAGSDAIDAGVSVGCPATDQRGISRPQGTACDAGAFEVVVAPPAPVEPAPPSISITKKVATAQAGTFGASAMVPLGSVVWYQIVVTNTGSSPLTGITLLDSAAGGGLPAGCPALPSSLAAAASYSCTYPAPVLGSSTNIASATVAGRSVTATATVTAGPPVLTDSIAPGVNRGTTGFGTSSVILSRPGYVTFLVRLEDHLAGRPVEIWTRSKTGSWVKTTTRLVAADGTVHYYARIFRWTAFQAKLGGGGSHGRIATVR